MIQFIFGTENASTNQTDKKIMMENNDYSKSYLWVCRTIDNCNSLLQLQTAEKLIENFQRINKDAKLLDKISWRFSNKANELSYYKWKSA
jgi:hypothetical protein